MNLFIFISKIKYKSNKNFFTLHYLNYQMKYLDLSYFDFDYPHPSTIQQKSTLDKIIAKTKHFYSNNTSELV